MSDRKWLLAASENKKNASVGFFSQSGCLRHIVVGNHLVRSNFEIQKKDEGETYIGTVF